MRLVKIFSISGCFSFLNEGGPFGEGGKKVRVKVSTCQVPGACRGGTKHSCRAAPRGLSGNCTLSPDRLVLGEAARGAG